MNVIEIPVLYTGTDLSYERFLEQTGFTRKMVIRVNNIEKLHGWKDQVLLLDWGFDWVLKNPDIMRYCRSHNIKLFKVDSWLLYHAQFIFKDIKVQ